MALVDRMSVSHDPIGCRENKGERARNAGTRGCGKYDDVQERQMLYYLTEHHDHLGTPHVVVCLTVIEGRPHDGTDGVKAGTQVKLSSHKFA